MGPRRIDRTGQRFGEWTAVEFMRVDGLKKSVWLMRCSCGTKREIRMDKAVCGRTTNCGCKRTKPPGSTNAGGYERCRLNRNETAAAVEDLLWVHGWVTTEDMSQRLGLSPRALELRLQRCDPPRNDLIAAMREARRRAA